MSDLDVFEYNLHKLQRQLEETKRIVKKLFEERDWRWAMHVALQLDEYDALSVMVRDDLIEMLQEEDSDNGTEVWVELQRLKSSWGVE